MKYLVMSSLCVLLSGFFQYSFSAWYDSCELRSFKATAYYSPEEGQKFYVKWSLEEDKILNGEWTHGASGRAVFNGMIAAPKSYAFGTRIYVPWWWIGQIEDRGGAIVQAGERNEQFDRLDFWAGKGQAWLDAALRFGVRYFDAYVCPKSIWWDDIGFSFSRVPLERKLPATLRDIELSPGMISSWTPILQRYLKTLWYMRDIPESVHYGEQTTAAVCAYQQEAMWISASSERCWWFWKQTRLALQSSLKSRTEHATSSPSTTISQPEEQKRPEVVAKREPPQEHDIATRLFAAWGEFDDYMFGPLAPGDTGQEVRILQRKLQRLGHYPKESEITWVYDAQTIRAVYAFQLAQWLLIAEIDPSVYGYLWPKTRAKINSV